MRIDWAADLCRVTVNPVVVVRVALVVDDAAVANEIYRTLADFVTEARRLLTALEEVAADAP